jgi:hypothetical protein
LPDLLGDLRCMSAEQRADVARARDDPKLRAKVIGQRATR